MAMERTMERTRDYFSKFLKPSVQPVVAPAQDRVGEFHRSWMAIKGTLEQPDERQLRRGIKSTDVPVHLQTLVDLLVSESTRAEEGATGQCLEYLLKNDVLGTLVKLSETDRPFGIQAEVLRSVQNMVILMDEQFLVHTGVHKAVLRLLRSCVGDDLQEQMDNRSKRVMGAAGNTVRSSPSEYEEDLVNLLCILCSRIRTFRELLMIFFHDKNWGHSEPLFSVDEEDEDEEEEEEEDRTPTTEAPAGDQTFRVHSPAPSQSTAVSAPTSSVTRKSEYEFLLFNYLLRFVHREGKIGEFARAGLLFLMDVAMSPHDTGHRMAPEDGITSSASSETVTGDPIKEAALSLAEYILDGDFTEVLAAGLGAVYSLLPSKLDIRAPKSTTGAESGNMVLGSHFDVDEEPGEANTERARNLGISKEDSSNLDFKARLDHFLKLLEFLEDIFRRNTASPGTFDESTLVGSAIVESILDAVRRVFMENILYPSILECSDGDGSAVAVMSYIDVMIRTLEHGQLADVLVNFLMTEDNDDLPRSPLRVHGSAPPQSGKSTRAQKLNRRRSSAMVLLEMDAPDARRQSEYFTSMGRFTLKDLLLTNLRSKDEPTAATALQLLQSLLYQHNSLCVERLLLVARDPTATIFPQPLMINPYPPPDAPVSDDESEEFVYPGALVDPEPQLQPPAPIFAQPGTTYATHEREMSLYLNLVSRIDPMHVSDAFSTGYDYYLRDAMASIQDHVSFIPDFTESALKSMKHRLNPNDPLLTLVLEWLRRFLSNKPESNMALTGVLAALAYDPNRSLAGWLTFGQTDQSTNLPSTVGVQSPEDDGDDRSIDCDIERRLASEAQSLPASSMNDQSRPVVFTILQGLVGQLERYRQTIDDFDKYLSERRQGLLFSENLTDALALTWDPDDPSAFAQVRPSTSITSQSQAPSPPQRAVPKKSNSFVSFLTPRKSKPPTPKATPTRSATNPGSPSKNTVTGPFGPHYQRTNSVIVEPFDAPLPNNGPWTPARSRKYVADDEDDVFSAGWNDDRTATSRQEEEKQVKTITLSQLLDNVVLLEESIKELVAIIHARKSLAVDGVRYV